MIYQWVDPTLSWNPKDYDDVTTLYVPAVSIWHPDIVLYNTYVHNHQAAATDGDDLR